jgi:hypothetical protein
MLDKSNHTRPMSVVKGSFHKTLGFNDDSQTPSDTKPYTRSVNPPPSAVSLTLETRGQIILAYGATVTAAEGQSGSLALITLFALGGGDCLLYAGNRFFTTKAETARHKRLTEMDSQDDFRIQEEELPSHDVCEEVVVEQQDDLPDSPLLQLQTPKSSWKSPRDRLSKSIV